MAQIFELPKLSAGRYKGWTEIELYFDLNKKNTKKGSEMTHGPWPITTPTPSS